MSQKYKIRAGLQPQTKSYMRSVITELEATGAIKDVDSGALSMLAENYDLFLLASEQVKREGLMIEGRAGMVKHPLLKVATDAQIQALKVMQEFGLTAKSRERIKSLQQGDAEPDALDEFLSRGKE